MKNRFGVVIAAGGTGSRFGTDIPKQYVEIKDVPVIAHTLQKFSDATSVSEIVIVTHKDYLVFCNDVVKAFDFCKVTSIIEGGSTRQESVYKGLKCIKSEYVLIHDAARPLVSVEDIENCCRELLNNDSCALGAKVVDTLKFSEDGTYISSTVDRSRLWSIQTPQCFKTDAILKCHRNAVFENFIATDDCMLAEKYGLKIKLIEAKSNNFKITNYKDLAVAEVLLDAKSRDGL